LYSASKVFSMTSNRNILMWIYMAKSFAVIIDASE